MRNGENADNLRGLEVNDIVGKARYGQSSDREVRGDSRNWSPDPWEVDNPANGRIDGIEELDAKAPFGAPRTNGRCAGTRRRLRPRTEHADSPPAQFGFSASPDVLPGKALRLAGHDPAGSLLDLGSPGSLHFSRILGAGFVKAGEQLSGHVGPFVNRQGQGFAKNFLRSGGHTTILDQT